jgi:hypothetical protein
MGVITTYEVEVKIYGSDTESVLPPTEVIYCH